ncbi:sulfur transferase domain-containing protein [Simiduia sp. 21SJ11W-1]|uniref:beta-lactamase hydrolase domain-containing protein n=1 Tax=Simiduia sp. 21SJ11W-1 TaxID=2909669 RepID=UPI00209D3B3E|nr:sulfur transferase domain-containing protein [Simiduia sp. 21SJ11W-1]UTA48972.1 sulfur transferase domain-containing protein [Simiduia sp. 21SJ11W-1]
MKLKYWILGAGSALLMAAAALAGAQEAKASKAQLAQGVANFHSHSPSLATGGLVKPEALAALKAAGFTQIIDLRTQEEGVAGEQTAAEALGLEWHHLPTAGELPSAERLAEFGALLQNGKTLVHCRSGNRVGMTWALWQISQGKDVESALAEARAMGMKAGFESAIRAQVKAAASEH